MNNDGKNNELSFRLYFLDFLCSIDHECPTTNKYIKRMTYYLRNNRRHKDHQKSYRQRHRIKINEVQKIFNKKCSES